MAFIDIFLIFPIRLESADYGRLRPTVWLTKNGTNVNYGIPNAKGRNEGQTGFIDLELRVLGSLKQQLITLNLCIVQFLFRTFTKIYISLTENKKLPRHNILINNSFLKILTDMFAIDQNKFEVITWDET